MIDKIVLGKDGEWYYLMLEDTGLITKATTLEGVFEAMAKLLKMQRSELLTDVDLQNDATYIKNIIMDVFGDDMFKNKEANTN